MFTGATARQNIRSFRTAKVLARLAVFSAGLTVLLQPLVSSAKAHLEHWSFRTTKAERFHRKYCTKPQTRSRGWASRRAGCGQRPKYWAFFCSYSFHLSGRSSAAKMAETGQTGAQAPQSIHSTGSIKSCCPAACLSEFFLGWMQSTGQASTQAVSLVPMQGSAIMYAIKSLSKIITEYQYRSRNAQETFNSNKN